MRIGKFLNSLSGAVWELEIPGLVVAPERYSTWTLDGGDSIVFGRGASGHGVAARVQDGGQLSWTRTWSGGEAGEASAETVSVQGDTVWSLGRSNSAANGVDEAYVLSQTNLSDGLESSASTFPILWTGVDIAALDNEHVCVAAIDRTSDLQAGDPMMLLLDAAGEEQRRVESIGYPVNGGDEAYSETWNIAAAPDGTGCCMVATRFDFDGPSQQDIALSTVSCADANGNLRYGLALDQGEELSHMFFDLESTEDLDLLLAVRDWGVGPIRLIQVRKIARPLEASL